MNRRNRRAIKCIENGKTYTSIVEAARELNVSQQNINHVLAGRRTNTGGYHFVYADENNNILSVPEVVVAEHEVTIQKPAKMIAKGKRCNGNTNAVLCISTGQVFTSCADAAEQAGTGQANMSRACRTIGAKANGKSFCYVKDINEHLDEVAESIRKANMYDELMTKREKHQQLVNALGNAEYKVSLIEYDIERLHEQLKQAHLEVEKAKHDLMHFEW